MLRFYNLDIGDWWRGDLSSRRVLLLLEQLPEDSSFFRARYTGDRWTETQHLLAFIADQITFMRREAQGEESTWSPKQFPRPNDAENRAEKQEVMDTVHDGLLSMMAPPS